MFTGIVEEVGQVCSVSSLGDKARLGIKARSVLEGTKPGDSINIDGVCQTVTAINAESFSVDSLGETLKKTTLGALKPGSPVNLERALRPSDRMGGHFVQGHVTCTVRIKELRTDRNNLYLAVEIPEEQIRYCVPEGSIALDGISLTIAGLKGNAVTANIIPVTLKATSLGNKKPGDSMNLETDIIGRYVESLLGNHKLSGPAANAGLSLERLRELGFK